MHNASYRLGNLSMNTPLGTHLQEYMYVIEATKYTFSQSILLQLNAMCFQLELCTQVLNVL